MAANKIPTALQRVRGNPGRRPLNDREPVHVTIDPAIPDEVVDDFARAEWLRLITTLTTAGHIVATDRTTLAAYCNAYASWRRLDARARDEDPTVHNAKTGSTVANPVYKLAQNALGLLLRASAELGLTPSSRSRIVATPTAPPVDAFTRFQKSRSA